MPDSSLPKKEDFSFRDFFVPVWSKRKNIFLVSAIVGLLTLGVNFLLPKYYKANAIILPDTEKNKLSSMSSFAGLASLAGLNVSGGDISRLYPVIMTSESVLTAVIERKYATERFKDSVNLIQYMELDEESPEKNLDLALKIMRDLMNVVFDSKTNVVTATVEMRESRLAADVLNSALEELDRFLREKKTTSATEQRKWIESRLIQVNGELRYAEESLKNFREKNRRVNDSPELMLQQERLLRNVQIENSIDVELVKQAEITKIEEIKQISTISILDEGRAPVKKERPKRATNAAIAFLLTLAGASGFYAVRSLYGDRIGKYIKSLRQQSITPS